MIQEVFYLKYEDLDKRAKASFLRTISKAIGELSQEIELHNITTTIPTEVFERIKKDVWAHARTSQIVKEPFGPYGPYWSSTGLKMDDKQFEQIVIKRFESYRKRKTTKRQLDYYIHMTQDLGQDPTIPKDRLIFNYNLKHLHNLYMDEGSPKPKMLEELLERWIEATGEELDLPRKVTRSYVREMLDILRQREADKYFNL